MPLWSVVSGKTNGTIQANNEEEAFDQFFRRKKVCSSRVFMRSWFGAYVSTTSNGETTYSLSVIHLLKEGLITNKQFCDDIYNSGLDVPSWAFDYLDKNRHMKSDRLYVWEGERWMPKAIQE